MTSEEPLPLSIPGQAIVSRAPTSPKHEFYTFYCSAHVTIMFQLQVLTSFTSRCVTIDLGYLGCHSDVLNIADRHCSGRQTCEIRVPDPDMENTRPCLKELKTYLEANYTCLPSMYYVIYTVLLQKQFKL